MGFVLSGMNGGNLIAPFISGAVYDHVGYYAVWGVCLGLIAFDFVLPLGMIEKSTARKWLKPKYPAGQTCFGNEEDPLLAEEVRGRHETSSYGTSRAEDSPEVPIEREVKSVSWPMRRMPAMATLLGSPRILAAMSGCFTHALLISSFDTVLTLFVKRTFLWSSTGAGLILLAVALPSTMGTFVGYLSDRFGTRSVALFGFGMTMPCLALLGVINDGTAPYQVALIVLLVANGRTPLSSQLMLHFVSLTTITPGIGLTFILAPLATDMLAEVDCLANENPSIFGQKGAYARAYALFDAALGVAIFVGPGWSGALYEMTNWPVMAGTLALLCLLGGAPVYYYTGPRKSREPKGYERIVEAVEHT